MTDLIGGSHYSLGLLFEAILNCYKEDNDNKGKMCEMCVSDNKDILKIIANCISYIEDEQAKVDAIVITNIN